VCEVALNNAKVNPNSEFLFLGQSHVPARLRLRTHCAFCLQKTLCTRESLSKAGIFILANKKKKTQVPGLYFSQVRGLNVSKPGPCCSSTVRWLMLGCQNIRSLGPGEIFRSAEGSWELWEKFKVPFQVCQRYLACPPPTPRQQTGIELTQQDGCLCQRCESGVELWQGEGTLKS